MGLIGSTADHGRDRPRSTALSDRNRLIAIAAPVAAAVAAVVLISRPEATSGALRAATPLLLLFSLLFGVLVIRFSAVGTAVLVAFIYLDLSEALVRYHFPSLLQLLVVALVFAAWLKRDTAPVSEILLHPLTMAMAAWLLIGFVSTAWAADRDVADRRAEELLKAFVLYLLLTALMRNRHRLMQGVAALLASAALLGALVMWQFVTGDRTQEFGGLVRYEEAQIYGDVTEARLSGPVGDPNLFAQVLLIVLPIAVLLGFSVKDRRKRIAIIALACVVLLTIALTYSRGAMLAVAVMAVMMIRPWSAAARRRSASGSLLPPSSADRTAQQAAPSLSGSKLPHSVSLLFVGLLALLVIAMMPAGVTKRFLTVGEILPGADDSIRGDSSIAERRIYMAVAAAMFSRHPLQGVGLGNFPVEYDEYVGEVGSSARIYPRTRPTRYPHNLYLEIAAETGIIGLFAFTVVIVAAWSGLRRAERTFVSTGDEELAHVATALRIALAGFLVASLFLHLALARYLFLLFAFASSASRIGREARMVA
ncbi:MAG TPA: O-antigen ligase family protein [Thermoanaerobaculia bacterium]|nr:O-antigen ligase family protein [Thermoanaerobaculia bacterium]